MEDASQLFDQYAGGYEAALEEGLHITGESPAYFAEGRMKWTQRWLDRLNITPRRVLDFGCGTGGSIPYLLTLRGVEQVVGVDVSEASLNVARTRHTDARVTFQHTNQFTDTGTFDLAFCNGVFHHIPPADRPACVGFVRNALRPGGVFALWENNPWNPGVRYIMKRVSFDKDAITLSPFKTRSLLRDNNLTATARDFLFIFPRALAWLRPAEGFLYKLPIGGQYLTIGRK